MRKITTLFFDLDGTLLDSDRTYDESLSAIGVDPKGADYQKARAEVKKCLGTGHASARNRLLYFKEMLTSNGKFAPASVLELMDSYENELESRFSKQWKELGHEKVMSQLAQHYDCVILTNENLRTQLIKVKAIDSKGKYFKRIFTSEEVGFEKPNPTLFEKALADLKVQPGECVMIGNQVDVDLMPALALGIYPILTQEFADPDNKEDFDQLRPCSVIRTLNDLPGVLKELS